MSKWEYCQLVESGVVASKCEVRYCTRNGPEKMVFDRDLFAIMAQLGDEGWELTQSHSYQANAYGKLGWWFKRPKG